MKDETKEAFDKLFNKLDNIDTRVSDIEKIAKDAQHPNEAPDTPKHNGSNFCTDCGDKLRDLPEDADECTDCGIKVGQEDKHCTNCGSDLSTESD